MSRIANALNFPLSVETVCVFTAPIFSAFAAWAAFFLTKVSVWLVQLCANNLLSMCESMPRHWSTLWKVAENSMNVGVSHNKLVVFLQEVKGTGAGLMAAALLAMVMLQPVSSSFVVLDTEKVDTHKSLPNAGPFVYLQICCR